MSESPESPFQLLRLVTVATFSTPWEAQIAQARLAAENIHSLIAGEHLIRMVALSNAIGGLQLQVREEDATAAGAALQRFAPLPEIYVVHHESADGGAAAPTESRCPGCGSSDLRMERSSRRVLGVLSVPRRAYRCGACGVLWKWEEVETPAAPPPEVTPFAPEETDDETWELDGPSAAPGEAEDFGADAPLAAVARFHTPWEAHLARTLLESEGLRAVVFEERLPPVNLLSAAPLPSNRLEVRAVDAPRAAEILRRAWSYPARALPEGDSEEG